MQNKDGRLALTDETGEDYDLRPFKEFTFHVAAFWTLMTSIVLGSIIVWFDYQRLEPVGSEYYSTNQKPKAIIRLKESTASNRLRMTPPLIIHTVAGQ